MKFVISLVLFFSCLSLFGESQKAVWHSIEIVEKGIELKMVNLSDEDLFCNFGYLLRLQDQFSGLESYKRYEIRNYSLKAHENLELVTASRLVTRNTYQILVAVESIESSFACENKASSIELDRSGIESALRNSHFNYAWKLYTGSMFKDSIKVVNLSNSYFDDRVELKAFNFNHIETDTITQAYKMGNEVKSLKCGYINFEKATEVCGIKTYKLARAEACGVELYYESRTSACGCQDRDNNAFRCISGCGCKKWFLCRHPSHGVQLYNFCRRPEHGVESYNTCRDKSHGVENAKICQL
ncbi:MAG: hypothetical protein CL674_15720 [Bdellovibrionaceae bacterium]|nr:hypothetical protein [Pseudobdellovibrionaceae bacterium]